MRIPVVALALTSCLFAGAPLIASPLIAPPEPIPFRDGDLSALADREADALASAEWGVRLSEIARRRAALATPIDLRPDEAIAFAAQTREDFASLRAGSAATFWKRFGLYFPDRFLDLFDILSLPLPPAAVAWAGVEVHFTRWASFGAFAQAAAKSNWYYNRNLTIPSPELTLYAGFGPFQAYSRSIVGIGTGWRRGAGGLGKHTFREAGLFSRRDEQVMAGWSDPFGIGTGWLVEFHPVEFADFIVGLLSLGLADISRDDYANPDRVPFNMGVPGRYYIY